MIQGFWFAPQSSAQQEAALELGQEDYKIWQQQALLCQGSLADITISDRMGNIPRRLKLPDGGLFETRDNDAIDTWLKQQNSHKGWLHQLESSWNIALVSLLLIIFCSFAGVRWGIPWASYHIAHYLPAKTNELISSNAIEWLDQYIFETSELSKAQQQAISQHFSEKIIPLGKPDYTYRLHFRAWPEEKTFFSHDEKNTEADDKIKTETTAITSIPNAFALPSGDIIVTDGLVQLAENQEQIDSVLLHEMGHVEHRHGLQQLIQSSFLAISFALITGDINGIEQALILTQTALIQSQYSRQFERDADLYTFKKMLAADMEPLAFAQIMDKLEKHSLNKEEKNEQSESSEKRDEHFLNIFSTHPNTQERIDAAKYYSRLRQEKKPGS